MKIVDRNGRTLFEGEYPHVKGGVEAAVRSEADLIEAHLSRADLTETDLIEANLSGADLTWADLSWANLSWADLSRADLSGANLSRANLAWSNLTEANLTGANLSGAEGIPREWVTQYLLLLDQPGPIRAYKLVKQTGVGPFQGTITYAVGQHYEVSDADTDPLIHCSRGINLADLSWCIQKWSPGYRILIAEFTAADIACIPTATDGKFRVHRCTIVGEKDLVALGLETSAERKEQL